MQLLIYTVFVQPIAFSSYANFVEYQIIGVCYMVVKLFGAATSAFLSPIRKWCSDLTEYFSSFFQCQMTLPSGNLTYRGYSKFALLCNC